MAHWLPHPWKHIGLGEGMASIDFIVPEYLVLVHMEVVKLPTQFT